MEGKYIPTQASNTNNAAINTPRLDDPTIMAVEIAAVADNNIAEKDFSTL